MKEEALQIPEDTNPVAADLFRRIAKSYLGAHQDGRSTKERQARLQKLILDAVENKNSNGEDDEEEA